jgi:hypothetical protein
MAKTWWGHLLMQEGIPALDASIPDSLRGPDEREACFPCALAKSPAAQNAARVIGQSARWWGAQAQRAYAAARPHLARAGQTIADAVSRGVDKIAQAARAPDAAQHARSLAEKLALDEARGGAGTRIMQGRINDPRYPEEIWAKMSHARQLSGGGQVEIHYWENLKTGVREGFKFK